MIPGLSDQNVADKAAVSQTFSFAGKSVTFESGRLARLAQGSIVIQDTEGNYLLTTAGVNPEPKSASFFPLTVEFVERYYATGKIGGNRFMKREGRPSETATLNSRLIDRPIRPMFPKGVQNDVQIISTILSSSGTSDFGFWGITGASLSLMLAGVDDFEGPVAGVRIAMNEAGEFIFDPSIAEVKTAKLDLTIAGTLDAITMVESQAREIDEATMSRAFAYAHGIVQEICRAQLNFLTEYQKSHTLPVIELSLKEDDEILNARVAILVTEERIRPLFFTGKTDRKSVV